MGIGHLQPNFRYLLDRGRQVVGIALLLATGACHPVVVPALRPDLPANWRTQLPLEAGVSRVQANRWWLAFHDPALDALVEQALSDNPGVAQARQRLLAARELATASRHAFRPTLHAGTAATPDPDATTSYLQGSIDAEWELGLFGRATATRRIADADVLSSVADRDGARVTLVADVVRDYLELRSAQQQQLLMQRILAATQQRQALTQRQVTLQLATQADLMASQSGTLQAQAALVEPEIRIATSAQQLAVLLGQAEPPAGLLQVAPLPIVALAPPQSVPADLLRARPDIRHAESDVIAAAGELGIATADLYPRVNLLGAILTAVTISGGPYGFSRAVPSVGPGIDIPLFDWGVREARVRARKAGLEEVVLGYRATVLAAVAETEIALASLRAQQQHAAIVRQQVSVLERADQLVNRSRTLGLADDLDRNHSQVEWMRAQLELIDADHAQSLAFIALCKALGGVPPSATDTDG